jgi:hypothetical protein
MSWDNNVYYNPEAHGLTLVAEHELSEPNYSYDTLAVFKDDEGFYLATDSGCSCPVPFENYEGKGDLTGPLTAEQAVEESRTIKAVSYESDFERADFEAYISAIEAAA